MEAPRLGFSSRKQFSSPILSDYEMPRGLNLFFFTPPSIYRKIGEELATQLAQAS